MSTLHPPTPPCPCDSCRKHPLNERLIQVHIKSLSDIKANQQISNVSLKVCDHCLVQHNVPVLRPSSGKWELGLVQVYDSKRLTHQVVFVDEEKEWVTVTENPFVDYIGQFVRTSPPPTIRYTPQDFFFGPGSPAWTETGYENVCFLSCS
jgi:hypothetical protein